MTSFPQHQSANGSLHQYRSASFEHCSDGLIVTTLDGLIVDWNAGATRIFGWTREEMLGRTPAVLHRECDATVLTDAILVAIARTGRWSGHIVFIRRDGSTGICATAVIPMRDEAGNIFATLGVNRDITEEKAAHIKLTEEKHLLQTLIDALPDPVFVKDSECRFLLVNAEHKRLWNFTDEDLIGKRDLEVPVLREHAALYATDDESVLRTGEGIINREEPFIHPNGEQGWFLTSKSPFRDNTGAVVGIVGTCRIVTERRRANQTLANEREKLRTVLDAVQDIVFMKDLNGRHTMQNAAGLRLFPQKPELIHGTVYEMDIPQAHADLYSQDDRLVFTTGAPIVNREEPFRLPDGGQGTLLTSKFPLRDSSGAVVGLVGIGRDITQIRKDAADREALNAKLLETQKLESLGVLAGGIAHDFNNLLGVVLGNATLAIEARTDDSCMPFLEEIEKATTRAADLCKQMLAYSGRGTFVVQPLDLNAVIRDTTDLLRVSIKKKVELRKQLAITLPAVIADETQLRQVLMNLVINASEAIGEGGGHIAISTGVVQADRAYFDNTRLAGDLAPGEYVYMEVSDNGHGMSSEVIDKIFDPFFTTKFTGRGLGLAAVLGIVHSHRGALKVYSEEGRGTTFKMLLPSASNPAEVQNVIPAEGGQQWQGQGVVLLVDDEEPIRVTAGHLLKRLGFSIQAFSDGAAALAAFAIEPDRFSLVVADLTMPVLDGAQLSHAIRCIRPSVPVLLMSGFTEKEALKRSGAGRHFDFIQKPFTLRDFREKLQTILNAARAAE